MHQHRRSIIRPLLEAYSQTRSAASAANFKRVDLSEDSFQPRQQPNRNTNQTSSVAGQTRLQSRGTPSNASRIDKSKLFNSSPLRPKREEENPQPIASSSRVQLEDQHFTTTRRQPPRRSNPDTNLVDVKPSIHGRDNDTKPLESLDHSQPGGKLQGNKRKGKERMRESGSRLLAALQGEEPESVSYQAQTAQKKGKSKIKPVKASVPVYIPTMVTVADLARLLGIKLDWLQRRMKANDMEEQSSYDYVLTADDAGMLAEEFGRNAIFDDTATFDIVPRPDSDSAELPLRPPIVTIMGHVDHGKTTLLDTLRSTSVAKGEAGGITQHIGAFSVQVPGSSSSDEHARTITFLDTPGHAAFSAMRARGASVTDIIVLVVAADDSVMPQTKEVIKLIQSDNGNTHAVVAINKIDKPGADATKVKDELLMENIILEENGGDIPALEVSGLTGQGLDSLMETISTIAEVQEFRAERDGQVQGYVLESRVTKGLGSVATVLVVRGCMSNGTHLIAGKTSARVRLMQDSTGQPVKDAYPGMAVTVCGWKDLPVAGTEVLSGTEDDVKQALTNRLRAAEIESLLKDVEAINASRIKERSSDATEVPNSTANEGGPKELCVLVKGDVTGSVEALVGAIDGIGNQHAKVKVVQTGVGDVTESDIAFAKVADAMIIAFSVKATRSIENAAGKAQVPIYRSDIIYRVIEEVQSRLIPLLPVVTTTRVTGEATVQALFTISLQGRKQKTVAGCRVFSGLIEKNKSARVVRDDQVVHEGPIETMRILKKDVEEVRKGTECGLNFANFEDLKEGDIIKFVEHSENPGTL